MRSFLPAACIGCFAFTLLGCGDVDPPYSHLVAYTVRTDPIVTEKLGDERDEVFDPDRPGQLPLFSFADWREPLHPLHKKSDEWTKKGALRDPAAVPGDMRDQLEAMLNAVFGSPTNPTVGVIDEQMRETLKVDLRTLERGSIIYRVQCLHCHGVTGDGRGPTARWINPHPRDYRQGLFKFQSVNQTSDLGRPPRRADLHRVIKYGVEGTAMPSFVLLPDSDIDMLVSYVMHLSMRGQVEYLAFKDNIDYTAPVKKWNDPIDRFVGDYTKIIAQKWLKSQQDEIRIDPYPYKEGDVEQLKKSVARGQELFLGKGLEGAKANCVNCHKDYGRQAKFRFDMWGTLVRPNNLTQGTYRGGRRTVDLYHRIHSGINGSGMAAFGNVFKNNQESVWDLVNFVQALPYPTMRKNLGINIE